MTPDERRHFLRRLAFAATPAPEVAIGGRRADVAGENRTQGTDHGDASVLSSWVAPCVPGYLVSPVFRHGP